MTLLKPVESWLRSSGYNEIQESFLQCFAAFSLGKIYIYFHRKKGIPSLLHKSISLLRLPVLHIHYSYTTRLALSLFMFYLHAKADSEQGDLTGGLPVTSDLDLSMCFSRVSDMRYLLCSSGTCYIFSVLVGMREQLQCGDPSCEESRRCWQSCSWYTAPCWEVPGGIAQAASDKMNGMATALFHIMEDFWLCCSKNASKLSRTVLKSFLRENVLCGWKGLLLLILFF